MLIDVPVDFIAFGYTREESVPFPAYPSGGMEQDNPIYTTKTPDKDLPLLLIEEDLIREDGRGLKRGFYIVAADIENNFLLLYQSGKLKAKVPIISVEPRLDKPLTKEEKKKKKKKKNYKGIDPEDFIYNKAEIFYDAETTSYLIIWDRGNTRIKGAMKLW